jgi:hypothetical protein
MFCPKPAVYWRKRAGIKQVRQVTLDPGDRPYEYVPRPCVLYPERVTDYPDAAEFNAADFDDDEEEQPPVLRAALNMAERLPSADRWQVPDSGSDLYERWLCVVDGTKVGGYPDWVQDADYPRCGCGAEMEHLLSLASCEYDGANWGRWLPIEDRPTLLADYDTRRAVQSGHNCMFGDAGNMYVFMCRKHREPHVRASMQCS